MPAIPSGWACSWPRPESARRRCAHAAADPRFLATVLDFVMRDDATVKAFAKASQLHPTNIAAAHQALNDPALGARRAVSVSRAGNGRADLLLPGLPA